MLILLTLTLLGTHGHYYLSGLIAVSLGTLWAAASAFAPAPAFDASTRGWHRAVCLLWVVFAFATALDAGLLYALAPPAPATVWLQRAALASAALAGLYAVLQADMRLLPIAAVLVITQIALVLWASPTPYIDVFVYAQLAADHLLAGDNPYAFTYPDLYNGRYDLTGGYPYWPLNTYLFAIPRALGLDVRAALCAALVLSGAGVAHFARQNGLPMRTAILTAVTWLAFPLNYFVLEQGWYESLILPLWISVPMLLHARSFGFAGVLLGVLCTTKQYMVFAGVLVCVYVMRQASRRQAALFGASAALAFAGIMAPAVVPDAALFWQRTVSAVLSLEFRDDGLSFVAALHRTTGVLIPGMLSASLYLFTLAGLLLWMVRKTTLVLSDLIAANVLMYSVTFLFGKQAFCNYYYLLAFMTFTWIISRHGLGTGRGRPAAGRSRTLSFVHVH